MLVRLNYTSATDPIIVSRTGVGSLNRSFNLPIEMSGVTVGINGVACGLKAVSQQQIDLVVPPALSNTEVGSIYPLVINNNGTVIKGFVTIIPTRPDIFNTAMLVAPLGRAKLFNVVNTVHTTEPFAVKTIRRKGNVLVPTVLRIYVTGMNAVPTANISVRIGSITMSGTAIKSDSIIVEPGVDTFDFELPETLFNAGDQAIVVTVTVGSTTFSSRLDDTTSRVSIL